MASRQMIETKAYIHSGGALTDVDTLTCEHKIALATQLKKMYLNEIFEGTAVFSEFENLENTK